MKYLIILLMIISFNLSAMQQSTPKYRLSQENLYFISVKAHERIIYLENKMFIIRHKMKIGVATRKDFARYEIMNEEIIYLINKFGRRPSPSATMR